MFNGNYDYAKVEVARRHEGLITAQRNGTAFQPRGRRPSMLAAIRARFTREAARATATAAPAISANEPCLDCP